MKNYYGNIARNAIRRNKSNLTRLTYCPYCFEKQKEIDQLKAENQRLKSKLHYQERHAQEGCFGSSTPSSKIPIKKNTSSENPKKQGGAKPGHSGHGRHRFAAEEIEATERFTVADICPDCSGEMKSKGLRKRTIIDCVPVKIQKKHFLLEQKQCVQCGRIIEAKAEGVLPRFLYSNQLLTYIVIQHYLYGQTLGQIEKQTDLSYSAVISALHYIAKRLEPVMEQLIQLYRQALVKHADESSWRNNGQNGYAWLFATSKISIFRFRHTRSSSVVKEVLGDKPLPGVLVVDRYAAYNVAPCKRQFCFSHILRDVEDILEEFPEQQEVRNFCEILIPLLSAAMKVKQIYQKTQDFLIQAEKIEKEIITVISAPAKHPAIQNIQNLFREKAKFLYHWAKDPSIPADNNLAERDLRPLVIARKISFGSQSLKGAQTREILMSIIHSIKKQTSEVALRFKFALDQLALNPSANLFEILFQNNSS